MLTIQEFSRITKPVSPQLANQSSSFRPNYSLTTDSITLSTEKELIKQKQNKKKKINKAIFITISLIIGALLILKGKKTSKVSPIPASSPIEINNNTTAPDEKALNRVRNTIFNNPKTPDLYQNGIGFCGPNTLGKEQAFNNFIEELSNNSFEIITIPKATESNTEEITQKIRQAAKNAAENYKKTGHRTALVIKELDIIGNDKNTNYISNIQCAIKDLNLEESNKGKLFWIWEAQDPSKINKSLSLRSIEKIYPKPIEEDSIENIEEFINFIKTKKPNDSTSPWYLDYAQKLINNKK